MPVLSKQLSDVENFIYLLELLSLVHCWDNSILLLINLFITLYQWYRYITDCITGPGLEGFRFSKKAYSKVKSHSPMFALDCEMVTTSDQRASLASVCVVDENLQTVYKSLVKPDKPITDYITKYV